MTTQTWSELSQGLAAAVRQAEAAVVRIDAGRRTGFSGAVWAAADGVIVTTHHGLEGDGEVDVALASGETVRAEVAGRDPSTDLAVLRARAGGLASVAWSDEGLAVGHVVLAVTRPGRGPRAALGVISRLGDAWRTAAGGKLDRWVELDVALHPGFSGGLVLDPSGRALGLATAGLVRGTPMVVPVATLARVVHALLDHGSIRRGYLGVASLPVPLPRALRERAGQPAGLLVTAVEEDSPAALGGVLLGDVLLSLGGTPVAEIGDLLPLLEEERVGRPAELRVARAGSVEALQVTIGARGERAGGGRR